MSLVRWIATVGCCVVFGCSSQPTGGELPPTAGVLDDLNGLVRAAAGTTGRVPPRIADLDRFRDKFPRGYQGVKSGDVVVLWGTALQGEDEAGKDAAVVAYEKNAPTEGGYVLMSAGAVRRMTAEEFGAAPKAGK
jgi:hypothetical protein